MVLAWRTLCKAKGVKIEDSDVVISDISVVRPTLLTKAGWSRAHGSAVLTNIHSGKIITFPVKLDVIVAPGGGDFEVDDFNSSRDC